MVSFSSCWKQIFSPHFNHDGGWDSRVTWLSKSPITIKQSVGLCVFGESRFQNGGAGHDFKSVTRRHTHTHTFKADISQLLLPYTATLSNTFADGVYKICVCDLCGCVCVGLIYFLCVWGFVCACVCVNTVSTVHITGTYTDHSPISYFLYKPNTLLLFGLYRFLIYCSSKVSHTDMCRDEDSEPLCLQTGVFGMRMDLE